MEEGEKGTKFFYDLEKKNYLKKHICKLKLENDAVKWTRKDRRGIRIILPQIVHTIVHTANFITINEDDGFIPDSWPKLTPHEKTMCDKAVTIQECTNTLKMFKNQKAPVMTDLLLN